MSTERALPPGQREIDHFPRFGMPPFDKRFRAEFDPLALAVGGEVEQALALSAEDLSSLPRVQQASDFHCVTTWTKKGLRWGGFRFVDFHEQIVRPKARPLAGVEWVILRCQDGYRAHLPLADLLAGEVLLADSLEGAPLSSVHGAPLRLIAPAHYGYKSAKHLKAIELCRDPRQFRGPRLRFMIHPRARVAFEERGIGVPGWLLRFVYRPLIGPTIRRFEVAVRERQVERS